MCVTASNLNPFPFFSFSLFFFYYSLLTIFNLATLAIITKCVVSGWEKLQRPLFILRFILNKITACSLCFTSFILNQKCLVLTDLASPLEENNSAGIISVYFALMGKQQGVISIYRYKRTTRWYIYFILAWLGWKVRKASYDWSALVHTGSPLTVHA